MNTKTIKFDLNKYKLYEKIKAKQRDTKSRFLLFQLLDGSIPFNLKNRSVRAYMIKPDGREIFNDLIVNNYNLGYCTLELTNQVLAVPGTVKIELMVTEEEKKLTSSVFELEVIKSINSEKSIVSTNEFTALLNGLASLSEYDNYKNSVKSMEVNKADKAKVEEKFGEVYEQLEHIEKGIRPVSQYLINVIKSMMEGEKVVIDCYGDSTYWGHASGVDPIGSQVSEPPTVILQKMLRSYFKNDNIIVNNYGAKGNSTQEIINTINPNTEASVIFFNYCINDAKDWWTDVETYKNNIIKFVESFRAKGKEVILDMPNIVTGYDFAGHGMGTQLRALQVSIMADVMLDVSKKINIPLIDNYNLTQQYTYSNCYMPKILPDGMHPSDEMYIAKALNMASVFISQRSSYVDSKSVISCIDSSIVSYGTSVVQKVGNSLCGCALMANSIKIGLHFTENCKLYLAFPVWSSGSDNVQIVIDGKVQKSINLKNENLNPTISYLTDMLVLINENMTKGFHVIEINNASTGNVGLNYLMTTPISEINPIKAPYEVSKNYNTALAKYNINSIEFENTEEKETIVTYNIPTEILNNDLIMDFNATLKNGEGIGLLTTQRTNVSTVSTEYKALASLLIYIADNKLKIATGDNVDYDTSHLPLSENNYGGTQHNYKIILSKSKELSLFIDGNKIVDKKQIDIKCVGGYLSLWKANVGTMKINNLSVF